MKAWEHGVHISPYLSCVLCNLPCPATLQKSGPVNYPQLKGSFPENLKHLKNSMNGLDWKVNSLCWNRLFPQ